MKNKPIYVEIPIESNMEKLWEATQKPNLHEQWDLRFSSITYLPKKENEPQKFTYSTKIGFGMQVEGWGKSVGSFHAENGSRTSSLQFGTEQFFSIIREGRGYWKYIPKEDSSITFLTQYNYQPSFGKLGKIFDRFVFRPLIGWATALSFDVLKRWIEKGETPQTQYLRFFSNWLIAFLFFFVWVYHGLIPKLIMMHPKEIYMVTEVIPISYNLASNLVIVAGVLEVLFGFLWLIYSKKRQLLWIQCIMFPLLTLSAIVADTSSLGEPFNPLTFNLSLFILTIIGLLQHHNIPSAKNCIRKRR